MCKRDLTLAANQLESSMVENIQISVVACVPPYSFVTLESTVEKSVNSVSLVKILGYSDGEIGKLYSCATGLFAVSHGDFSVLRRKQII